MTKKSKKNRKKIFLVEINSEWSKTCFQRKYRFWKFFPDISYSMKIFFSDSRFSNFRKCPPLLLVRRPGSVERGQWFYNFWLLYINSEIDTGSTGYFDNSECWLVPKRLTCSESWLAPKRRTKLWHPASACLSGPLDSISHLVMAEGWKKCANVRTKSIIDVEKSMMAQKKRNEVL